MIPKNTTTSKARGTRRERALRLKQLKTTRALEAAKPENIAKANLSKLKTYPNIGITTAGYNADNQIRTFHTLVPKEKELAFALRFNNSQKKLVLLLMVNISGKASKQVILKKLQQLRLKPNITNLDQFNKRWN